MVQKSAVTSRNVVDLKSYRQSQPALATTALAASAPSISARACRHCGALMADDESDDDCSSVFRALESRGTRL